MQTSTFGVKFDSLRYDVPLKIRSRSSKHKKLKLSQWYAQTTIYLFIRYHAFTQEREWGSGRLILTSSLTGSAQKYVPPPFEWGEIKRVVYVWRQTKPIVTASKNIRKKRGNKTEFCYHWVQCLTKCLSHFFHCCAQNYCVSSSHIHVYDLSWFMSPFPLKCLVNGEILSAWWIYTHSFTDAASQIIGKYGEL